MAVMNFDLEDGLPPISFTLRNDEVTRFMDFLAECQAIKESPQRTWVGLTDEEIYELHGSPMNLEHSGALKWVRTIEAKLKEKNND